MKQLFVGAIRILRWLRSKYYTFITKRMLRSYGSIGVNGYSHIYPQRLLWM